MTATDPEISLACEDLLRAVTRLESLFSDGTATSDIALLRVVARRLSETIAVQPSARGLRSYDPARFRRLLDLAGPENAAQLLTHLAGDLGSARRTAERAAQDRDWPALRGASHVLISLTGSVGALSLQEMSERLHTATHQEDGTVLPGLMPDLLAELDTLLTIIATTQPPRGGRA